MSDTTPRTAASTRAPSRIARPTALAPVHSATYRLAPARTEPTWTALFDPVRFDTMKRMATILLASGFLPKAIKTEAQVITILIKGYELGLPPMEAVAGITVIDGKPAVSPQLMLALINRSGQLRDLVIDGASAKCSVTMARRGRKPHTETFTIDDARRMTSRDGDGKVISLADKYNWRQMPAVMLRWRAVSACARIVFPDVISGLYTPEEMGADVVVDEDGTMQVVGNETARGDTRTEPPQDNTNAADPDPARADGTSTGIDPVTSEVGDTYATTTRPAAGGTEEPSETSPRDRADTPPLSAATHDKAAGAAAAPGSDEGEAMTGEEREALTKLVIAAAQKSGFKGKRFAARWLLERYGVDRVDALTAELRERARADAIRICTTSSSSTTPSEGTAPAGADAASPATLLRRLFERDGEDEERQRAIIREFTRRTKRVEDMTSDEIRALIDTRWPEEASATA